MLITSAAFGTVASTNEDLLSTIYGAGRFLRYPSNKALGTLT